MTAIVGIAWCPEPYGCAIVQFHPILNAIVRYFILVLFDLPFVVIFVRSVFSTSDICAVSLMASVLNRSITTPEMLPFFGIRRAVRALLSPREQQKPWLLYLTPGLLLVVALQRAWDTLLIPVLIKLISRHIPEVWFAYGMNSRTLVRLSLVFVHTAIFGPLEVIKVRLAIQRSKQPVALPEDQHDGSDTGNVTDSPRVVRCVDLLTQSFWRSRVTVSE